jgi:hypothetical protein
MTTVVIDDVTVQFGVGANRLAAHEISAEIGEPDASGGVGACEALGGSARDCFGLHW